MASLRTMRPLLHRLPLTTRPVIARRSLAIPTGPVLASSHAKVVGAREGHIDGDSLSLDLAMPKQLGGTGAAGRTNPEELFAAGYGACFQSAMNASARALGKKMPEKPEDSVIETTVHLVGDMQKLDIGIKVEMLVKVRGMSKEDVQKVVDRTIQVCPYSRATQGNVETDIQIEIL